MKYISFFFILTSALNLNAQKFQKTIEFQDKLKLWNYSIIDDGTFVFHQSQYTMTGSPKNGILKYYDSDGNEMKGVKIDKKELIFYDIQSVDYLIGSDFVTNGKTIKSHDFKPNKKMDYLNRQVYGNHFYTLYQNDIKNDRSFVIEKLNLDNLTSNQIDIVIPKINEYKGKPTFQMKEYQSDPLTFLIKEYIGKKQDSYHILKYNTSLLFESQIDLNVDLENKYLRPSNNGAGGFTTIETNDLKVIARRPNEGTMGNVLIQSNSFYCFGMYGNTEDKSKGLFNNQTFFENYTGNYIFKFDGKGILLWKNFYPIINSKLSKGKVMAYRNIVGLEENTINGNLLLFISNFWEKKIEIYEIDSNDGKLLKNSSYDIKMYNPNPPINGYYGLKSDVYLDDVFGKKIKLSHSAILAIFGNDEFFNYVKRKSEGKSDLSYDAKFTKNGLTVFEELDKKDGKYNILKF